ncbi:MAG: amino acid ABC transporter substrate-binding protein [Actinomycetota bacterium]
MSRGFMTRLIALLAVMVLAAAACERGEDEPADGQAGQAAGNLLQDVIDRGTLRCGVNETVPGFGFAEAGEEPDGFDVDFCRAFAAAIVGDPEAIELTPIDADNRFIALQNGDYDVLVRNTTWTTSRDGTEGVAFAHPNFYDGQAMMVRTESEFQSLEDMNNTSICVTTGTTTELNLADVFDALGLNFTPVSFEENTQLQQAFIRDRCDGWTSDRSQLAGIRSAWPQRDGGPDALRIMDDVMSKEPLAPGVLDSEIELHDVIDAVVNGIILAEELGVTSDNVNQMASDPPNGPVAALLGAPVPDPAGGEPAPIDHGLGVDNAFMQNVIAAVGNYGEIFNRHIGPDSPLGLERGINALWTEGGIQYAIPFR